MLGLLLGIVQDGIRNDQPLDGPAAEQTAGAVLKYAEDLQMIREAGFTRVDFTRLSGGIVAIHSGWKL